LFSDLNERDVIQCNNIESEIWSRISKFENEFYVGNYLRERLKVLGIYKKTGLLNSLTEGNINDELKLRITNTAKQAREFYYASYSLPLLSKPILMMYTFEKLAELLVLTTFDLITYEKDNSKKKFSHGLSYDEKESFPILVKSSGLFDSFHDCYDNNSDIYKQLYSFRLEDLLRRNEKTTFYTHLHEETEVNMINYYDLFNPKTYGYGISINSKQGKVKLHELDREFIFIFAISTLARYKVNTWSTILSGKDSDMVIKISEYLQTIQSIFPNLILNNLLNYTLIFVPIGFMGKDKVSKIIYDDQSKHIGSYG
jgi:hypothetical protein